MRHKVTSGLIVLVSIVIMVVLMQFTSSELVPQEDTGTVMVTVATPPGTSREKTEKLLKDVAEVAKAQDGVEQVMSISGFSLMGGAGSNYGSMFISMKPSANVRPRRVRSQASSSPMALPSRMPPCWR